MPTLQVEVTRGEAPEGNESSQRGNGQCYLTFVEGLIRGSQDGVVRGAAAAALGHLIPMVSKH